MNNIAASFAVALLVCAFPAIAESAECHSNPVMAASSFYKEHRNFSTENPERVKALVTPRLYQLLKKEFACPEGEECALAADPWSGAQDGDIEANPKFSLVGNTGPKATVGMAFKLSLEPGRVESRKTQLVFALTQGCYILEDVVANSGESSLLQQLESFWK